MYHIEEVIKHRKPMRLIDQLVSFDDESASVIVNINEKCEFYDVKHHGVPSYIGIEYMAQCIAAKAGANDIASGGEIKLGFLLGTRKYKPTVGYFNQGETLLITATKLMEDSTGLSVFNCSIIADNPERTLLADAKINVYQPVDSAAYLQE